MAKDGSSSWGWIPRHIISLLRAPARPPLVRRNTSSEAPPDHSAPTPSAPGPLPSSSRHKRKEIRFYHKGQPYDEFTNFAPYDVVYKGKRYPTSEHLFQAFKFLKDHPQIAERIRSCGNEPHKAFDLAHEHQRYVRNDWKQVNLDKMRIVLRLKFTQHQNLKDQLLGTGDNHLIEDSPTDYWWGIGADQSGQNQVGNLLEELREELRKDSKPSSQPSKRGSQRRASWPNPHPGNGKNAGPSTSRADPRVLRPDTPKDSPESNLCEFCRQQPKNPPNAFCSKVCSNAYEFDAKYASLCENCHAKRKQGGHRYCGRTCAIAARVQAMRTFKAKVGRSPS